MIKSSFFLEGWLLSSNQSNLKSVPDWLKKAGPPKKPLLL